MTYHSDNSVKVNMGNVDIKKKLSNVANPLKISTRDFFNFNSL